MRHGDGNVVGFFHEGKEGAVRVHITHIINLARYHKIVSNVNLNSMTAAYKVNLEVLLTIFVNISFLISFFHNI